MVFVAISSLRKPLVSRKANYKSQYNQPGLTKPTFISVNPNKVCCSPIMFSLDRYNESGTTLDYILPPQRKIGTLFIVITRINELKLLVKHISCDC